MSDKPEGQIHSASEGGIAGHHPPVPAHPFTVGPTTADEHNTIRPGIFPKACWRVEDVRFDFDSSFVRPEIRTEMARLASILDQHTEKDPDTKQPRKPVLSIFGHADPVGDDNYNKQLSGRRAQAIYGMLTRDADLWEDLFSHPLGGDNWNPVAIQTMQKELGQPAGPVAASARKQLFLAYMDAICVDTNGSPFQLAKTDLLARGADKGGKGDFQGCSEFNPVLIFSQVEEQQFAKSPTKNERNTANGPNRRVVVYLFRPGSQVAPAKWPCPRVKEGTTDCKKRFWSDGELRRSKHLQDERREYVNTQVTFSCLFYDRLAKESPFERPPPGKGLGFLAVRIFFHARPMTGLHVEFRTLDKNGKEGSAMGQPVLTDDNGIA